MVDRTHAVGTVLAKLVAVWAICLFTYPVAAHHTVSGSPNFGLTVPATSSGNYTLTWNGGLNLQLQEKVDGGPYTQVYYGTASSFSFTNKPSGTYTYRLRYYLCFHGCEWLTGAGHAVVVQNGFPAPASITGPTNDTDGSFTLSWGTVPGATHYPLERRMNGGPWVLIQDTAAVNRPESNLADGVYDYRAKACNPSECSGNYTPVKTVNVARPPGQAGTILGPDEVPAPGSYTLTWGAATGTMTHYQLEEVNGSSTVYHSVSGTSKAFGGKPLGTYNYRVRACNAVGTFNSCGGWTTTKSVTVGNFLNVNLTAPLQSVTGSYTITWWPGGMIEHLQQSVDGGPWTTIFSGTGGSYSVSGNPDGTYKYRIMRVTMAGWPEPFPIIEFSNSVTTIVGMIPEPPIVSSGVAGNLPYRTGVTKGGSGYVMVPLEPAPGVNGLQPTLSLYYASGRDRQRTYENLPGDTLGYGWQLTGLSHIRHCTKNQPDGTEIQLDGTDALCMNGEPLVLISGTHMQPGAEYRTLRESFHKIVLQGTAFAPWFEVHAPDGSIAEFGNSANSRVHHIDYISIFGEIVEIRSKPYLWSITRQKDAFYDAVTNDNRIEYDYYKDEVAGVLHPKSITYGLNDDATVEFEYVSRTDLEPVTLGSATLRQLLLLHTVRMNLNGVPVREYRLQSETAPAGWRRLDQIQLCGFDEAGATPRCLVPFDIDWAEPLATLPDLKTYVYRVTDSQDMITEFVHEQVSVSSPHAFIFTEEPFAGPYTILNTRALTPTNGYLTDVVTEVRRSDGLGGWHGTSYAYYGRGLESTKNWGFLGFLATRITDQQSGIVTYKQYRLDFPHFADVSATHQYDAPFGSATELLTKTEVEFDYKSYQHANGAWTYTPYRKRITNMLLENVPPGGTPQGAVEVLNTLSTSQGFVTSLDTQTRVAGSVNVSSSGSGWGVVPEYTLSDIRRSVVTNKTFDNDTTSPLWLVGFQDSVLMRHYDGAPTGGNLDRTQDATFARYGNTNAVGTQITFDGDPEYELTVSNGFNDAGYVTSRAVSGVNVAARSDSASNFDQGRYPGSLFNALGHETELTFDGRFGTVKSTRDPNERLTSLQFDEFGREKTRTTPDGVVITTTYERCVWEVTCASVGSVTPVTRIQTSSPVTPTSNRYLDVLGRIIRSEIESFDGTMIRQDTHYDSLGRVDRISQPYLASNTAYFVEFDYDIRNRIRKETRPDGSFTDIGYTVEAGVGVRQTITDTVLKADGTLLETQEQYKVFDRMGQMVESVDDSDATNGKAVRTTYDYDGSGQPETVTVDADGASLVTSFDFDDAGYRRSITSPDFGTLKSNYTALGELRTQGYGASGTDLLTTYDYDLLGRLWKKTDQDDEAIWTYDTAVNGIGLLHTQTYGPGFEETFSYNNDALLSGITTELTAGGLPTKTYNRSYLYDNSGRLEFMSYPSGIQVEHGYNNFGYLSSVTNTNGGTALKTFTSIDAYGNVTQESYGNGVDTARAYDPKTGRLTNIDTTLGSTVHQDNEYKWQSNGILERRETVRDGATLQESFTYDGLNRLLTATTNISPARTLASDYDDRGNLLYKTSTVGTDIDVNNYQYTPGTNRLSSVTIDGVSNTLEYDAYGNITRYNRASGDDKFIDWNARNMPSRITVGTSRTTTSPTARDEFEYGPTGQRYYKKSTWDDAGSLWAEHTFYVGNFEELFTDLKDTNHKSVQKSQIGENVLHVKTTDYFNVENSSIEYLHRDHLGSVEAVTDENGNELRIMAYDPFGERRKDDWTRALNIVEIGDLADDLRKSTSRGYTGHENLDRTGFVHMNGRVYDPQIGRFLSPDPIVQSPGYSQSWNRYSYVMNSPASFNDPSGFVTAGPMCSGIIMCANPDTNGTGSGSQSFVRTTRVTAIDYYVRRRTTTIFVGGFGGGDINDGGFSGGFIEHVEYEVSIRIIEFEIRQEVQLPDDSETDAPMEEPEVNPYWNEIQLAKDIGAGIFEEFVVAPIRDYAEGKIVSGTCRLVKVCSAAKRLGESIWKFGKRVFGRGGRAEPAPIHGNPQVTRKDGVETTHGSTSERVANEGAMRPDAESVHMNRQLRTIDPEIDSQVRPDVAIVRTDGKIDCCEVLSPGQTVEQQTQKLTDALGDKAGEITVIPPD